MATLDPTQSSPDPDPTANPGMRSVGTNTNDGEGLTILVAVTDDELHFSGSIRRGDLESLKDPKKKERARVVLEAVRVLLAAAHRGECHVDCNLGLTLTIHGFPIRFEAPLRKLDQTEHRDISTCHSSQMKQLNGWGDSTSR